MFEVNAVIGSYRVVRPLGRGGMAEVYEVENVKLGFRSALKVFTLDHGDVEFLGKRFHVEGRLLARLDHPRIVRVFDMDVDEASGRPYYVMDLVLDPTGRPRSLKDAMESGELTEEQVGSWYEDLREGLAYIHGEGIVHRDVTLENVLVGPDGRAVLSDFGVSKILPRDLRSELHETMTTMVKGGKPLMGKPFYLAPEVKEGADETPASDYYALGVMLLRMLTQVWYVPGARLDDLLVALDPRWRKIIPDLVRANPRERRCGPWHENRRPLKVVSAEGNVNEVFLRIRFPHWLLAGILVLAALSFLAVALMAAYEHGRRRMAEQEVKRLTQLLQEAK